MANVQRLRELLAEALAAGDEARAAELRDILDRVTGKETR